MNRPNIYEFDDATIYIKAMFQFEKLKKLTFSYARSATRMGISVGFLKNIVAGRRKLDLNLISRLCETLRLTAKETRFLTVMVIRGQIRDKSTRTYFNEILHTLKFQATQFDDRSIFHEASTEVGVLSDPIDHLVYSLVSLKNFREDPKWMKQLLRDPSVPEKKLKRSIETLIDKGFIEKRADKMVVNVQFNSTPDPYKPETFKIYRQGLRKVDRALENVVDFKPCNFFMANLTVNTEDREKIVQVLNDCRDRIMEIEANSKDASEVLTISNNLVTLASLPSP
jgi:uncharacterized protein (TIGR02147 family)